MKSWIAVLNSCLPEGQERGNNICRCEITRNDNMYFLMSYDIAGKCLGDSCHFTLSEAIDQAEYNTGCPLDWKEENETGRSCVQVMVEDRGTA